MHHSRAGAGRARPKQTTMGAVAHLESASAHRLTGKCQLVTLPALYFCETNVSCRAGSEGRANTMRVDVARHTIKVTAILIASFIVSSSCHAQNSFSRDSEQEYDRRRERAPRENSLPYSDASPKRDGSRSTKEIFPFDP